MQRRSFLIAVPSVLAAARHCLAGDAVKPKSDLAGAMGITTGSFSRHVSEMPAKGKLVMLDLPKIMQGELDLKVIDLMTATLPSLEPAYCERFRAAAEKAGCVITNLKMNQKDLDMASRDEATRLHALTIYKKTIDAAQRLGCRWVRPLPGKKMPDMQLLTAAYRELIEYAGPKGISLLIENNAWLSDDPEAIPRVIQAVGKGIAAQPDTGNWKPMARYAGLEKAFPLAVTCDFKALTLGPNGEHADYDLRRCFDIAWQSGFRGPWCFEHFHEELGMLFREFGLLRDMLRVWMKEKEGSG